MFILPNFPIPIQAVVTKKWASFSDDDAEIYMLHKNLFACSDKNFNILQADTLQNISQRNFTLDPIF